MDQPSPDGTRPTEEQNRTHPSESENEVVKSRLDTLSAQIRANLLNGGPDVDYRFLYLYIEGSLPPEAQKKIREQIYAWKNWFDAYWQVRAELDFLAAEASDEPS